MRKRGWGPSGSRRTTCASRWGTAWSPDDPGPARRLGGARGRGDRLDAQPRRRRVDEILNRPRRLQRSVEDDDAPARVVGPPDTQLLFLAERGDGVALQYDGRIVATGVGRQPHPCRESVLQCAGEVADDRGLRGVPRRLGRVRARATVHAGEDQENGSCAAERAGDGGGGHHGHSASRDGARDMAHDQRLLRSRDLGKSRCRACSASKSGSIPRMVSGPMDGQCAMEHPRGSTVLNAGGSRIGFKSSVAVLGAPAGPVRASFDRPSYSQAA